MNDEQYNGLIDRLDLLVGTLQLAHADRIDETRATLLKDPVVVAILDATEDWTPAGRVKSMASTSDATAKRRLAELVARGVLKQSGAGPSTRYKRTNLI